MNINKITKQMNNKILTNVLPYELKSALEIYHGFVKKISKTDFANSPRRYIMELEQLKVISEVSQKHGIAEESEKAQEEISKITEKLKNEFGITFNK